MIETLENFQLIKRLISEDRFFPRDLYVYILNGKLTYRLDGNIYSSVYPIEPEVRYYDRCSYSISDGVCILDELIDILQLNSNKPIEEMIEGVLTTLYNSKKRIDSYPEEVKNDINYSLDILYNRFPEKALLMELK